MAAFLMGLVIGGLALWVFMREHVLRVEAEIAAASMKKQVAAAGTPVKTRTVGSGPAKPAAKADKPVPTPTADEEE